MDCHFGREGGESTLTAPLNAILIGTNRLTDYMRILMDMAVGRKSYVGSDVQIEFCFSRVAVSSADACIQLVL
jgi:hypothetical protein